VVLMKRSLFDSDGRNLAMMLKLVSEEIFFFAKW
jgi:hypothetical protein